MKELLTLSFFILYFTASFSQNPVFMWESEAILSGPESVVYDPERELLYISNMRRDKQSDGYYGQEFISKANLKGEILELKWIDNLSEPTGITIFNDDLYIIERFGLVIYDLSENTIKKKIRIPSTGFINDISISEDSTIYISESSSDKIYTIKNDKLTEWISDQHISHPNGILFHNNELLINANSDSALMAIDIVTKKISKVAQLQKGIIDGLKPIEDDFLVSFLEGSLFRVTRSGEVTEILNTRDIPIHMADIEYIERKKLLILPAIWQHKIVAYRLE